MYGTSRGGCIVAGQTRLKRTRGIKPLYSVLDLQDTTCHGYNRKRETMDKHETLEPLIALFEEDGFKADDEGRTERRVWMSHRMGRGFWVDLDNYGVTVVMGHGYWGRGADLDEAKREYRRVGGRLTGGYTVLTF